MSRLTAKKNSRKVDELERTIENLRKDNSRLQEQLANTKEQLADTTIDLHYFQGTYKTLEKSLKVLDIIMDLLGRHCKIELVNGGTYYQIKIKIMGSGYSFGMSITKEEFETIKEVMKWVKNI